MVFSWVDGNDPEFGARRAAAMANHVVGEGDNADARIRQIDELKYALRSVHAFAPWVRRIFIATDSPVPEWLAPHPKVTIVRAEDHFTDLSALPVYNSHAVETQLHHIPGLAEHFLYSNDDMFFGRALSPAMFFSPGGVTKFVEAGTRIGLGANNQERSGFENAARVNRERCCGTGSGRSSPATSSTPLRRCVRACYANSSVSSPRTSRVLRPAASARARTSR